MAQIAMYVTEDGDAFGEDQSILNIKELSEMENLLKEQKEALSEDDLKKLVLSNKY
jgi:hypothetical protein